MYIVAIAWIFVVVLFAAAEATSPQGSLLGAFFTLLLYGALPLGIVLYVMGTPMRRRSRLREEAEGAESGSSSGERAGTAAAAEAAVAPEWVERHAAAQTPPAEPGLTRAYPDGGSVPPGDPVAPERKEP